MVGEDLAGGRGVVGVDVVGSSGGGSWIGWVEVGKFFEVGDGGGSWRRGQVGGGGGVGVFVVDLFR